MKVKSLIIALALASVSTVAVAQTTPRPVKQKTQQIRIREGYKSGELTTREVVKLKRQQAQTTQFKRQAYADGVVTPMERNRMLLQRQRLNQSIYQEKHDRQVRRRKD